MHSARLIGITQPVCTSLTEAMQIEMPTTPQQLLAFCARVSSSANQDNHATGPRLIRSLIRRQEWSPLEMVSVTMEITTTRDIARQILRHRSFSFQEFSQRYAEVTDELVLREARDQDPADRQSSTPTEGGVKDWWLRAQVSHREHVLQLYKAALNMGIAKEVARTILPEGMTPSKLYMAGTLRSWVHYVGLRALAGTQREHQLVAISCRGVLCDLFPDVLETLIDQWHDGQ